MCEGEIGGEIGGDIGGDDGGVRERQESPRSFTRSMYSVSTK